MILLGHDAAIRPALEARLGEGVPADALIVGQADSAGRLVAAAAFFNWERGRGTIEVAFASWHKRGASPRNIALALNHVFDVLECHMILAYRRSDNEPSGRFQRKIGFADVATIPGFYGPGSAGVVATLTRDAWAASRFNRT